MLKVHLMSKIFRSNMSDSNKNHPSTPFAFAYITGSTVSEEVSIRVFEFVFFNDAKRTLLLRTLRTPLRNNNNNNKRRRTKCSAALQITDV